MEDKILLQCPDMSDKEVNYASFIMDKIEKAGGSLKFQHISGHLSQLSYHIRVSVGASPSELMKFLRKYNKLFNVDVEGFVTLKVPSGEKEHSKNHAQKYEPEVETKAQFPKHIEDVMGTVIKVQPHFGFITIREPVKTTVYFTPANFGDKNKTLLSDFDVVPGKKLCLNATRGNLNLDSKYRATRVWVPKEVQNEVLVPNGFKPKTRQTRETGAYDPNMSEGSGKVQNIFPSHGFITVDGDPNNTVFFHKKCVSKVENVMDLSKILTPGDLVEYRAIRSTKKDAKSRWEATRVWIKDSGKRVQSQTKNKTEPAQKNKSTKPKKLSAVVGKIYPRSTGVVIKFGKNDEDLADADSCPFYYHDSIVEDVCWEFSEGDRITFDAIEIKSAPGWKALLGWVGNNRPDIVLPVDIGDYSMFEDEEGVPDNKSVVSDTSGFSEMSSNLQSIPNKHSPTPSSASSRESGSCSKKLPRTGISDDRWNLETEETGSAYSVSSAASSRGGKRNNRRSKSKNSQFSKDHGASANNNNPGRYPSQRSRSRHSGFEKKKIASSENNVPHTYSSKYYRRSRSSASVDKDVESDHSYKNYCQEGAEFYNSNMSSRDSPSRLSSKTSSKESLSSNSVDLKSFLKPNPKLYNKNWGDTPFPDEELDNIDIRENDIDDNDFKKHDVMQKSRENVQEENSPKVPSPLKPILSNRFLEIFNSEDEFSDTSEHASVLKTHENYERELTSTELNGRDVEKSEESYSNLENTENDDILHTSADLCDKEASSVADKPKPYIRRFSDLDGVIKKVYCRYADVENERLVKATLFFWNDFYQNGVPVANQFDDLKEVLKAGHVVKINCFEIVDDDGLYWSKVTMAWRGQKPRIDEITPHQFISQNSLSVSVSKDSIEENSQDSPQSMRHLNEVKEQRIPPAKFLTVAFSNIDDEDVDEPHLSFGVPSVRQDQIEPVSSSERYREENQETDTESLGSDDLSFDEALERMILDSQRSKSDIKILCDDFKRLFLTRKAVSDAPSGSHEEHSGNEVQTLATEPSSSTDIRYQKEMTTSSAQTIITGDVIAQSIFAFRIG